MKLDYKQPWTSSSDSFKSDYNKGLVAAIEPIYSFFAENILGRFITLCFCSFSLFGITKLLSQITFQQWNLILTLEALTATGWKGPFVIFILVYLGIMSVSLAIVNTKLLKSFI